MATHNIFATWDVGNTNLKAVFFNDDNEWMLRDTGAVEAFNQAHLADYLCPGVAVGTGDVAGAIYYFEFTVPVVLPMPLNFAIFDIATGDRVGVGSIRFSASGEVRYEVLPVDS